MLGLRSSFEWDNLWTAVPAIALSSVLVYYAIGAVQQLGPARYRPVGGRR